MGRTPMPSPTSISTLEQRVWQLITARRDALLADLRLHVGIPTGLGHAPGLDETRERFTTRCRGLGATVELIPGDPRPAWLAQPGDDASTPPPPTAVCRRTDDATTGAKAVLISGHLDTVHDPRGPFNALTVSADGTRATGPGCVDMKGGLVIAMGALEALDEAGVRVPWSFIMNSDEETGSFHSARALHAEGSSGRYAAALALEPAMADGGLAVSRGGSGQFVIDAMGRAAHAGRDFASGISAVDALARAIVSAHALSDPGNGVCVNVGPLWCPTPTNMVAPYARAWGNVRVPSPEAAAALEQRLASVARGSPTDLPHVHIQRTFNRPAKPLTPGTQHLAHLARAVSEALGKPLPFGSTAGVCDGNNLQAAGLPCIDTVGVRGGGLHTTDEWIDLSSLVERCQMLAVLMMRVAGVA